MSYCERMPIVIKAGSVEMINGATIFNVVAVATVTSINLKLASVNLILNTLELYYSDSKIIRCTC